MSNKIKDISIKNLTCYFFSDIINIKNFDPILTQMKSHRKIFYFLHWICDDPRFKIQYVKINSLNILYLIINKVNGYFEKMNENKHLSS